MTIIVRGKLDLDISTEVIVSTIVAPPITDGKAWQLIHSEFVFNVITGGTDLTRYIFGSVTQEEPVQEGLYPDMMVNTKNLVIACGVASEGANGIPSSYNPLTVIGLPVLAEVFLEPSFVVSLQVNDIIDAGMNDVNMGFVLELEEVKITSKVQQAILDSYK